MAGWFIDDITIHTKGTLPVSGKQIVSHAHLPAVHIESNSPNPFNAVTRINYQLSNAGVVVFEIYNLTGQLVTKRSIGFCSAGQYHLEWDGMDSRGNLCKSGIYFGRLVVKSVDVNSTEHYSKTVKMIYVK